jgi:hypothetical protein
MWSCVLYNADNTGLINSKLLDFYRHPLLKLHRAKCKHGPVPTSGAGHLPSDPRSDTKGYLLGVKSAVELA